MLNTVLCSWFVDRTEVFLEWNNRGIHHGKTCLEARDVLDSTRFSQAVQPFRPNCQETYAFALIPTLGRTHTFLNTLDLVQSGLE